MRPELDPSGGWIRPDATRDAPIVIVHVWAVSCSLCKAQMPTVRRWLADPRLQVVSVHTPLAPTDAEHDRIARVSEAVGLAAPIALDDDGRIADALNVRSLPAYFVFDADGLRLSAAGPAADRRVEEWLRDHASGGDPRPRGEQAGSVRGAR